MICGLVLPEVRMAQPNEVINMHDLKDIQRWMRHFNLSKEELISAVEKFGPTTRAVSFGIKKGDGPAALN
jgi:Protein of unknown function (DUF3606)